MWGIVLLAAVAAAAVAARRFVRPSAPERRAEVPAPRAPHVVEGAEQATVRVDLSVADPDHPSVERMIAAVARPLFADNPALLEVTVSDRDGTTLGSVARPEPDRRPTADPDTLREPRRARRSGHDPLGSRRSAHPPVDLDQGPDEVHRSLTERFELPDQVRARLGPDPDLRELVRAILEAAGHQVEEHGDVLRTGDWGVVVLESTNRDALGRAFLHFDASGARLGLAVSLQHVSQREIDRRELLAPHIRYGGPDAIQRMADATALGGDPLTLALGPPTLD